jgi:hypothetical protein
LRCVGQAAERMRFAVDVVEVDDGAAKGVANPQQDAVFDAVFDAHTVAFLSMPPLTTSIYERHGVCPMLRIPMLRTNVLESATECNFYLMQWD